MNLSNFHYYYELTYKLRFYLFTIYAQIYSLKLEERLLFEEDNKFCVIFCVMWQDTKWFLFMNENRVFSFIYMFDISF